jgi:signal transduction histidine kinase
MALTSHALLLAAGLTVAASGQSTPGLVRVGRPSDCKGLAPRVATRRRALKQRRDARERALLRARRTSARDELLPLIDHELRTPLTAVVGYTEMLLSGDAGELNRDQERMLASVEASGARLVELVEAVVRVADECLSSEQELDVADVVQRFGVLESHLG